MIARGFKRQTRLAALVAGLLFAAGGPLLYSTMTLESAWGSIDETLSVFYPVYSAPLETAYNLLDEGGRLEADFWHWGRYNPGRLLALWLQQAGFSYSAAFTSVLFIFFALSAAGLSLVLRGGYAGSMAVVLAVFTTFYSPAWQVWVHIKHWPAAFTLATAGSALAGYIYLVRRPGVLRFTGSLAAWMLYFSAGDVQLAVYGTGVMALLGVVMPGLFFSRRRRFTALIWLAGTAGLALLTFSPVIIENLNYLADSIRTQASNGFSRLGSFSIIDFLVSALPFALPGYLEGSVVDEASGFRHVFLQMGGLDGGILLPWFVFYSLLAGRNRPITAGALLLGLFCFSGFIHEMFPGVRLWVRLFSFFVLYLNLAALHAWQKRRSGRIVVVLFFVFNALLVYTGSRTLAADYRPVKEERVKAAIEAWQAKLDTFAVGQAMLRLNQPHSLKPRRDAPPLTTIATETCSLLPGSLIESRQEVLNWASVSRVPTRYYSHVVASLSGHPVSAADAALAIDRLHRLDWLERSQAELLPVLDRLGIGYIALCGDDDYRARSAGRLQALGFTRDSALSPFSELDVWDRPTEGLFQTTEDRRRLRAWFSAADTISLKVEPPPAGQVTDKGFTVTTPLRYRPAGRVDGCSGLEVIRVGPGGEGGAAMGFRVPPICQGYQISIFFK